MTLVRLWIGVAVCPAIVACGVGCVPPAGAPLTGDCRVVFQAPTATDGWTLVSDTSRTDTDLTYLTASGFGDRLDSLSLLAPPFKGMGCETATGSVSSDEPSLGTLRFEDRRLILDAELPAANGEDVCRFTLTATVERCGESQPLFQLGGFDATATEVRLAGAAVTAAPLVFYRTVRPIPAACTEPITSLPASWSLTNAFPLELPFSEPTEGVVVSASGSGDTIQLVDITGSSFSCFADEGTISFDGVTLLLDVPEHVFLPDPGFPDDAPSGESGNCSLHFSGRVTRCDFLVSTAFGTGPTAVEILRLEGTGQFRRGDVEGTLEEMYLLRQENVTGCGLGLGLWMPLGFAGLVGFHRGRRILHR